MGKRRSGKKKDSKRPASRKHRREEEHRGGVPSVENVAEQEETTQPSDAPAAPSIWAYIRSGLFSYIGIFGLALTMFGNAGALFELADWAKWVVAHWHAWAVAFWQAFEKLAGVSIPREYIPYLNICVFWTAAMAGGAMMSVRSQLGYEEIPNQRYAFLLMLCETVIPVFTLFYIMTGLRDLNDAPQAVQTLFFATMIYLFVTYLFVRDYLNVRPRTIFRRVFLATVIVYTLLALNYVSILRAAWFRSP